MPVVDPGLVLTLKNVSKIYQLNGGRSRHALKDVSMVATAGSKISIMGRSGSGKSTLLNLVAGIDLPSAGEICVLGRDMAIVSERERTRLRRDGIGMVFQFFHLLSHLTVEENVALPALIAGARTADYSTRLHRLLKRVGLASRAGDSIQTLSGGEMQRVAICRALLRKPRLLLADEPTGNLDDDNGRAVMQLMLQLVEEQDSTLIYVTHDRSLAAMADASWRLRSGSLEPM